MNCKFCGNTQYVKNGFVHGLQRYRCKKCKANFINGDKRKKYDASDVLKSTELPLNNFSIGNTKKLTGIPDSQISKLITDMLSKTRNELGSIKNIPTIEIDELYSYVKKAQETGKTVPLYGLLLIENQIKLLILK